MGRTTRLATRLDTLTDRLTGPISELGTDALACVLATVSVTLIDRHRVSDLAPHGPLPAVSIERIVAADHPAAALVDALDALARRWPHVADTVAPLSGAAQRLAKRSSRPFARAVTEIARFDFTPFDPASSDVVGRIYSLLRSPGGAAALGAFYTPAELSRLLVVAADPGQGDAILEPACGTGGLFAAAADHLRSKGVDPWSAGWFGVDIDRTAVALAACNAVVWGLGPHVWLHAGDGLTTSFVTVSGDPVTFQVVLTNPPFGGRVDTRRSEPVTVVVDPAGRRAAAGLNDTAHPAA